MKTFKSKVTQHRGNSRVWIEGQSLIDAGFTRHTEYYALFMPHCKGEENVILIRLKTAETPGKYLIRKVSGRKRKGAANWCPIIDLCSKKVTEILAGAEYVQITINGCEIKILPAIEKELTDSDRIELAA